MVAVQTKDDTKIRMLQNSNFLFHYLYQLNKDIMNKLMKISLWVLSSLFVLVVLFMFLVWPIMKNNTKKHSPEQNISYSQGDLEINAFYCSPSKKGRTIFGELVPYGEVWRTGANEASTFTTNKDLIIGEKTLEKGTYTLWTIPGENTWDVIFNSEMYGWGVKFTDQTASRNPDYDALVVTVPVSKSLTVTENFKISFSEIESGIIMTLAWDTTVVPVLLQEK